MVLRCCRKSAPKRTSTVALCCTKNPAVWKTVSWVGRATRLFAPAASQTMSRADFSRQGVAPRRGPPPCGFLRPARVQLNLPGHRPAGRRSRRGPDGWQLCGLGTNRQRAAGCRARSRPPTRRAGSCCRGATGPGARRSRHRGQLLGGGLPTGATVCAGPGWPPCVYGGASGPNRRDARSAWRPRHRASCPATHLAQVSSGGRRDSAWECPA